MVHRITSCFIVLCAAFIELSRADCMDGWVRFGDSCYFFGHDDKSFMDAEKSLSLFGRTRSCQNCLEEYLRSSPAINTGESSCDIACRYCVHFHAHLANIGTSSEGAFIKSFLADLKEPKHWIGVTDEVIEGVWKYYPSETTVRYQDWGSGEPNQGKTANCVAIWESYGYGWVDEPCSHLFKPLCERPANYEEVVGR